MSEERLLNELKRMVNEYISDKTIKVNLEMDVERTKVKYILAELEKHKNKEISDNDKEIIKDLYYYFC